MDISTTAQALVDAMTDSVHRHFSHRRKALVPPRLDGRYRVAGAQVGEQIMDRVDELLETECETWPMEEPPEVYLDLFQEAEGWWVAWTVDTEPDADEDEDEGEAEVDPGR